MHPQRKIPVTLASLVALLALVAGSATVPTAAADAEAMQGRRVATKFKKINWPATPGHARCARLRQRQDQEQEAQQAGGAAAAEAAVGLAAGRQGQDQQARPLPPQAQDELVPQEAQDARRDQEDPQGRRQHQQEARVHGQPGLPADGLAPRLEPDRPWLQDPVQPVQHDPLEGQLRLRTGRRLGRHPCRHGPAGCRDRHPLQVRRLDQRDPRLEAQVAHATPTWSSPGPPPRRPSGTCTATTSDVAGS